MSPEDRRREAREAPIVPPPEGSVFDTFKKALPDVEMTATQGILDVIIMVGREDVHRLLETARSHSEMQFDFLRNLSGVDYEENLEVVYHLYSYSLKHNVTIRARVPNEDPWAPTASDIWQAADWYEREVRDMFGINFPGHPNLVPILLPDDMLDHFPLRKDNPLAPLEEWQGVALGSNMAQAGHIPAGSGFEVTPAEVEE